MEAEDTVADFPELAVPNGERDVLCKLCRRSKWTTPNTTMSRQMALQTGQLTLRWRRERGFQCAPCYNYQGKKSTPDKFKAHAVPRLDEI